MIPSTTCSLQQKLHQMCAFKIMQVVCWEELLFCVNPAGAIKPKHCAPWTSDWGPAESKGRLGKLSADFPGHLPPPPRALRAVSERLSKLADDVCIRRLFVLSS